MRVINLYFNPEQFEIKNSAINHYIRLTDVKGDTLEYMVILRDKECSDSASTHVGSSRPCDS